MRPPRARREKPKVSAFTSAKIDRILELQPDLVLGFSDLQADIAAELMRAGIEVHVFNHRSVAEILRMIRTLGGMVGCEAKAAALVERAAARASTTCAQRAAQLPRRPRVYFEEWDEPQISAHPLGVGAGRHRRRRGLFPGAGARSRSARTASSPIRSKCRAARPTSSSARGAARNSSPERSRRAPAGATCPRCATASCYEIKSSIILQPGPAALTDGVARSTRICAWAQACGTQPRGVESGSPTSRQPRQRLAVLLAGLRDDVGGSFGPGARLFQSSVSR